MTVIRLDRPLRNGNATATSALPVLYALVTAADERARVREAARDRATVVFVERAADLEAGLDGEQRPLLAVVVVPHDADRHPTDEIVRSIRRRLPRLPIVGYCRVGAEHSAGILAMASAGVHELVFHGVDDTGLAFRSVLSGAAQACAAECVLAALQPIIPSCLHPYVGYCIRHPDRAHTVAEVAVGLGLNRKTFVNYSARTATLPPAELLAWCRLVLAAYYLGTTTRTVEWVALHLDFPSDTAFRNMVKRYTGLRAREVRERGGMRCVLDRLRHVIADHQHAIAARAASATARAAGQVPFPPPED